MPTRESIALEQCGQRQARLAQETRKRLDEYVRRARLAGASWQTIGAALGITRQSAWERFRNVPGCAAKGTGARRLPRPPAQPSAVKQKCLAETEKRVRRMRSEGASWQAIGAALGITRQSAWERFRNVPGCAVKQRSVTETEKRVRRMRSDGASWQAIGVALGITRQSAWGRFQSLCVYRKDQGLPERVLQVRHRQPHIFAEWVIDAAKEDKNIEQWLEVPDIDLGRMANFSRAVAPIELLGRDVLRYFLMAFDRGDKAQPSPPSRENCPICNRVFQNKKFLPLHRKRAHGKPGARA